MPSSEALTFRAGGHTAEMLALLGAMDLGAYCPRIYVVAATDKCATRPPSVRLLRPPVL